ncbi:hypothetical protein KIPB_012560, partial [Kipferlia bialata]
KAGHKDWEAFAQKVQRIRIYVRIEAERGDRPERLASLQREVKAHVDSVQGDMDGVPVLALLDAYTHDELYTKVNDKRIRDAFCERMEKGRLPRGREGERKFICSMTRVVRSFYDNRG